MYHISWNETPPHELEPVEFMHDYRPGSNLHPDVLHMGTRKSAIQIHRTHLHEYEADPDVIDPVIYGDAQHVMEKVDSEKITSPNIKQVMRGIQPMLFEAMPGDPREAVRTGRVMQYRNLVEDAGSVSFMVPKSAIAAGKVRHVGVQDITEERRNETQRTVK